MSNLVSAPTLVNIDCHIAGINKQLAAIPKIKAKAKAEKAKVERCKMTISRHVQAIKVARPNNWIEIVKEKCGLQQRSAYYYLAFAEGKASLDQHRAENRARVARHAALANAKKAAQQRELAAKQAEIDKLTVQVDRLTAELVSLKDERALKELTANYAKVRTTLENNDKLMGEVRSFCRHYQHHQEAIVSRIHQVRNAGAETLKATPAINRLAVPATFKFALDAWGKGMTAPTSREVH